MPTPHGGSGMPVALLAVLALLAMAGFAFVNRHRLVKYMGLPTAPDPGQEADSTSPDGEGTSPVQRATAFPGFNPDDIYGPRPAPGDPTSFDDTPTGT